MSLEKGNLQGAQACVPEHCDPVCGPPRFSVGAPIALPQERLPDVVGAGGCLPLCFNLTEAVS